MPIPENPGALTVALQKGWVRDPSLRHWLDQIPDDRYITTAWGRDYGDICPIKGVFIGGGQHAMKVTVDVEPV